MIEATFAQTAEPSQDSSATPPTYCQVCCSPISSDRLKRQARTCNANCQSEWKRRRLHDQRARAAIRRIRSAIGIVRKFGCKECQDRLREIIASLSTEAVCYGTRVIPGNGSTAQDDAPEGERAGGATATSTK